ncbi:ImmA/IrrE family metallo-endopeptidase [Tistrella mobilis]|uniref:ImmA/IrrE family metallo-endopeptidase n=1 Tax=Tistrella mobilis TaxID=171437 RepID=UPI003557BD0D
MTVVPPMPCRASKAVIQEAAEKYAGKINFLPGGDLFKLVRRLGGQIRFRDFSPGHQRESIHVRSAKDFDLFLPDDTSPLRDRFTIGHELGHLLLHYPVVRRAAGDTPVEMVATRYLPEDASDDVRRCEWEANWFAAAFLMPVGPFIQAWHETGGDPADIASRFFMSVEAVRTRARSLSLESAAA